MTTIPDLGPWGTLSDIIEGGINEAVSKAAAAQASADEALSRSGTSVAGSVATFADLPADARDGQSYIVRDQVALYTRNNNGQWVGPVPVQGAATAAAVAAAVPDAAVKAALGPVIDARTRTGKRPIGRDELVFNVRDYGAVGNGTGDDTAAIQATIAAVAAAGRGTVYLPAGTYRTTAELLVSTPMRVQGDGYNRTVIDAAIPADAAALRVGGSSQVVGFTMDGLHLKGAASHLSDALYIGNRAGEQSVADYTVSNVRISDFRTGIVSRYSWNGRFSNVRVHLTSTPIMWGPQVNNIVLSGSFSSFTGMCILTNCETIHFDSLNVVNASGPEHAFRLFQSHVVLTSPYLEFLARFIQVGTSSETVPSSVVVNGGRVCGDFLLAAPHVGVDIRMPWAVERGVESDTRAITLSNHPQLLAATRRVHVDVPQSDPLGVKVVSRWKGATAWPFPDAYGGGGVDKVAGAGFYTISSSSAGQGIRVASTLEVGKQYVLSYRIRKAGGGVEIRVGSAATAVLPVITDATRDFETLHIPFVATDASIRFLFNGAADVQYISLVEGLRFLDIGD